MSNQLRFAPLIRVSTEKQAQKGESLRNQAEKIKKYVDDLDGIIPDDCWKYSGQEHATPEQERRKLDQLLEDASKDKFDAVIVYDASRWSRDNRKSKEGLEVLKNNGIRFFSAMMEYDLFNPHHNFFLGVSAEVGELQARDQALKSLMSRIAKAKRNIPTAGKLPYGRTYDKATNKWGLDEEKARNIEWAAEQYLSGVLMKDISKILGLNHSYLWNVMNNRSGTLWQIKFESKKLNIADTVDLEMPRLLDDTTISAIREKAQANKTYLHGANKHNYLLSRMIFCKKCGKAFTGQTNHNGKRYYRPRKQDKVACRCDKWVPADKIEQAVLLYVFNMFGDVEKIQKAIERAAPDLEKINKMREEIADLRQKKDAIIKERDRLLQLYAKGITTEAEVEKNIEDIRSRLKAIDDQIEQIEPQIENQPDEATIQKKAKLAHMAHGIMLDRLKSPEALKNMPYEHKRKLMEYAFAGKDVDGRRLGVYLELTGSKKRPFRYEIRAILDPIIEACLPMLKSEIAELLWLDEYHDPEAELEKLNLTVTEFASH